jgi:hypothetical protein
MTLAALPLDAGEWSRFRGPNGSGVVEAQGLPVEFSPESNVAWRAEVPFGRSSPVVGERQIFLTGIKDDKLLVVALDRKDGSESWRAALEQRLRLLPRGGPGLLRRGGQGALAATAGAVPQLLRHRRLADPRR